MTWNSNPSFGPRDCILNVYSVLKVTKGTATYMFTYGDPGRVRSLNQSCALVVFFFFFFFPLSLKAGPQVVLGICLFALTSSFQACLQTTFPEIHRSQVASPSGQPVGGTCTKIVFPPVSTKAVLLESSRTFLLLHPPRPHPLSHPHPSHPHRTTGSLVW